jgi:Glycosyltransferase like family
MIAFATAVSDRRTYTEVALPGIERVADPGALIVSRRGRGSVQRPYNEMMDVAAARDDLEALVLIHQDLELLDDSLPERVRRAFEEPDVGLLGVLGARLSKLHIWLTPERPFGYAIGPNPRKLKNPHISSGVHEVDILDGALIVAAPWVVRAIRFDERLSTHFHGYDIDISRRVAAHGGKIVCEDIPCRHHTILTTDYDKQRAAGTRLAGMWDPTTRPREWKPAFRS